VRPICETQKHTYPSALDVCHEFGSKCVVCFCCCFLSQQGWVHMRYTQQASTRHCYQAPRWEGGHTVHQLEGVTCRV
jgi:hypothetical protein